MNATRPINNVEEIHQFAAHLNAQLDRCDNGEGMECASLDVSLEHYALLCGQFSDAIKRWGRDVFAGRVAYDRLVDEAWYRAGVALNNRAVEMLERAHIMEAPCYDIAGANKLAASLLVLYQLLDGWVSPQLAVGPSARQRGLTSQRADLVQRKMVELRPLPAGWTPEDVRQQGVFRKVTQP